VRARINLWDAHKLNQETARRLERAQRRLELQRDQARDSLERLGRVEVEAYDDVIRRFATAFERMKNVEIADLVLEGAPKEVARYDVTVRGIDFAAIDGVKVVLAGGGAGAAAGAMTVAGVGAFATASTGTAIGSLSGAAATNATLAWLGGGSIAAGGGGMAAGMVVLGGITAAPVLAIGGFVLRKKGREAIARARADERKAESAIAEMRLARERTEGIEMRAHHARELLERLLMTAREHIAVIEYLVDRNHDYTAYDEAERQRIRVAATLVKTARSLIDAPVLTDEGALTEESAASIGVAEQVLRQHEGR
jgi:hypothetical protein